jgi:methionyl aminopeptidase
MIHLKSEKEIEKMARAGVKLARVLQRVKSIVRPGIQTQELNQRAEELILAEGARPNFKGYQGFPAALCTSLNTVAVHQPPGEYRLKEGDVLSLDIGLDDNGFQSDMAISVGVGQVKPSVQKLMDTTQEALHRGIEAAQPGNRLGDIGFAVQSYVEQQGFSVIKELTGHGIGRDLHEKPDVFNFGQRGEGLMIQPGLVICIEPIISAGSAKIELGLDGFSYQTVDGSLSAHFEHMLAVTSQGPRILTELK